MSIFYLEIKSNNFLFFYHSFKHIAILWLCANWLAMSNSCHNPFIYGLCSVSFIYLFIDLYKLFFLIGKI
jgi:hypothetical protein